LRRFSRSIVVAALAVVGGFLIARSLQLKLPASSAARTPPRTTEQAPEAELVDVPQDGEALMTTVLATLERWPNVKASFRQSLRIADKPLAGSGEYWQQGVGNQRRTSWQWQTLVDEQMALFAQIYDRNGELWTDTRYPERRTVTRLDVGTLRRELSLALDAAGQGRGGAAVDELELLARGGLSQLIAQLRRSFEFGPPTVVVENSQVMLAMVGCWRKDALERAWPGLDPAAPGSWPAHLPHHVLVKVGRRDLFPRTIEYRRGADAGLFGEAAAAMDPLARYEFFDVQWKVTMPERLFEFVATDLDWHDVTAEVFEQLKPAAPAEPAAEVAATGTWRK
jgi:hypothetical protein